MTTEDIVIDEVFAPVARNELAHKNMGNGWKKCMGAIETIASVKLN